MLREIFLVVVAVLVLAEATEVKQCPNEKEATLASIKEIDITNCDKPPCRLRKKTTVGLVQKFVAIRDVKKLSTSVHATVLGIPLPFIGVDGTDACDKIYSTDDVKVGCPLTAGTEYIYKNEFPVLEFYPKLNLIVYWALVENGKPITCFEVPSKITS